MKPEDTVRKVIQFCYCCDYDKYCEVMEQKQDTYSRGKWEGMQKNFGAWFCDLDFYYSKKVVDHVVSKMEEL